MIKLNGSNRHVEFTAFPCEQSDADRVVLASFGATCQKVLSVVALSSLSFMVSKNVIILYLHTTCSAKVMLSFTHFNRQVLKEHENKVLLNFINFMWSNDYRGAVRRLFYQIASFVVRYENVTFNT